jgi:hypothetical protein
MTSCCVVTPRRDLAGRTSSHGVTGYQVSMTGGGPAGRPRRTRFCDASGGLPVVNDERHLCLYDHLQRLLSALVGIVHDAAINVNDHAIDLVDR